MNPEQRIKREILILAEKGGDADVNIVNISAENVDELYEELLVYDDLNYELESDFRCSGIDTGLEAEYSRHYESRSVGKLLADGHWVGWTYWYGGGKHGNPDEIDWMDDAYELKCEESLQTITVRNFTRIGVGHESTT